MTGFLVDRGLHKTKAFYLGSWFHVKPGLISYFLARGTHANKRNFLWGKKSTRRNLLCNMNEQW